MRFALGIRNHSIQLKPQLEHLANRKLLQLVGNDVSDLLQGLITNDIDHLKKSTDSMYAMFLNAKGRVLADTIIYKTDDSYLLDLHLDAARIIESHLKKYKLRRKVDITYSNLTVNSLLGVESPKKSENTLIYKDPRCGLLGLRILSNLEVSSLEKLIGVSSSGTFYKKLRYKLGIGEGPSEIIPEKAFPLECNCDYLNGVSFQKGCYIGQELTARTYHTGVIRKRLMPLVFNETVDALPSSEPVLSKGATVGRLRGVENTHGLGLLRVESALNSELQIGTVKATTEKPNWWPQK